VAAPLPEIVSAAEMARLRRRGWGDFALGIITGACAATVVALALAYWRNLWP